MSLVDKMLETAKQLPMARPSEAFDLLIRGANRIKALEAELRQVKQAEAATDRQNSYLLQRQK